MERLRPLLDFEYSIWSCFSRSLPAPTWVHGDDISALLSRPRVLGRSVLSPSPDRSVPGDCRFSAGKHPQGERGLSGRSLPFSLWEDTLLVTAGMMLTLTCRGKQQRYRETGTCPNYGMGAAINGILLKAGLGRPSIVPERWATAHSVHNFEWPASVFGAEASCRSEFWDGFDGIRQRRCPISKLSAGPGTGGKPRDTTLRSCQDCVSVVGSEAMKAGERRPDTAECCRK
jgi:hypothetical protein